MIKSESYLDRELNKIKAAHLLILNSSVGNNCEKLCHYTSLESCLKILESGELHLTDSRYCNDPKELLGGIELLQDTHNKYSKGKNSLFYRYMDLVVGFIDVSLSLRTNDFIKHNKTLQKKAIRPNSDPEVIQETLDEYSEDTIFIAAFSELGDNLGQWISYGDKGYGVAITFKGVKNNMHDLTLDNISIIKASYAEDNKKAEYIKNIYLAAENIFDRIDKSLRSKFFIKLYLSFLEDMIACKSSDYKSENELRLYKMLSIPEKSDKINYKHVNGLIKPYIPIKLKKDSILEITLGPKAEKDLNFYALTQALKKYGYSAKVKPSKIHFR